MVFCKITIMLVLTLPHLPGLHKISNCPGLAVKRVPALFLCQLNCNVIFFAIVLCNASGDRVREL